jgi:hypothetical protein
MDGPVMTVIDATGTPLRIMPCPVPAAGRHKLRGARQGCLITTQQAGPVTVQRRVSQRGSIMVPTQKIQVGMIHARKTVTVTADSDCFTVVIDDEIVAVLPAPPPGRSTTTRPTPPASHAVCADGVTGATVHLVNTPPDPPPATETEFDLLGALFSPAAPTRR